MDLLTEFQSLSKIAICHHPPNVDRLASIKKSVLFNILEPIITFITSSSPPSSLNTERFINDKKILEYQGNLIKDGHINLYRNYLAVSRNQGLLGKYDDIKVEFTSTLQMLGLPRPLRIAELSLSLKHIYAFSHFLSYSSAPFLVVLEDDAIPTDISHIKLLSLLKYFSNHYSTEIPLFIDIGGGLNMRSPLIIDNLKTLAGEDLTKEVFSEITVPPYPSSRTTCGYIINKKFASLFLLQQIPIILPSDLIIFSAMYKMDKLQTFWIEPPLFMHGSQDGSFSSTVQTHKNRTS